MNNQDAGMYAEKIARMLFTAPDGREGTELELLTIPVTGSSNSLCSYNWAYVVNNVRRILETPCH